MKRLFQLVNEDVRRRVLETVRDAPLGMAVTIAEPSRSLEQNARLWACLGDIAKQVEWYGRKLSSEDWKHIFSSSLRRLEVVPNLDGTGFVALGLSTSNMSKRELSDLMELISAFGAERNVVWSEPERQAA